MAESAVQIKGLTRFRSTLRKAGVDMADMKDANQAAARTVQRRAAADGPKRSERLVNSLRTPRTVAKAVIRSNLIYAPVIHWGWPRRHIRPQPFVTEAAAETRDEWLNEYEEALVKISNSVQGA